MQIAQIAPLTEAIPPKLYEGTERVISWLADELVALGHDVVLFASGDSQTSANLEACWPKALRLDGSVRDPNALHIAMLERVRQRAHDFDLLHFHLDYYPFSLFFRQPTPFVTTLHGRLDLPEHQVVFATFPSIPVISISDAQRRPLAGAGWIRTIHHGLPERLLTPQPVAPTYFAFLGRISPEKAVDQAIWIAKRCGVPLKIAAKVDAIDRDYFESEIRKLLTPPDVEYIGEINDGEKSRFLSGAIALLAPIAWPEPFGLVLIEAMACGTPVIAFNRGSVPEIVEDGLTGFIVERKEEAIAATDQLSRLSRGAIRRRFEERVLRHGGWRANILPSIAASWINDGPAGARTALENFWRRVLRATLLIKPRSKSPAEAGLKGLSMERLRANGISSSLTLCRRLARDC